MSKILITGGAGYIGSVLTKKLLDEGKNVTVLDNFRYNQNSLLDCCYNENFSVIRGDIRDENIVKKSLKGKDVIIHLAALVGAPICEKDPASTYSTHIEGTKLLLKLRNKEQKILFPCSNSGYGIGEQGKYCTEKSPLRPISLYGKTKVEAEKLIIEDGNSLSFRFATIFGTSPRMRMDLLVNDFVYKAINEKSLAVFEGHFKRNYLHIQDAARAFLHGIKNFDVMKGEIYNVGLSDTNISKIELCHKIKEHISELEIFESKSGKDPDKRDYIISNEKIEKTGFKTQFSLDFGIKELIKCYQILKKQTYGNV